NRRGTQELPGQSISGSFLVRMDGRVNLGVWGTVSVTGMTLDQAAEAVRQVVLKGLNEPKMEPVKADQLKVVVDVLQSNSKRYYVITDIDGMGQNVVATPCTGNESVLDAIGAINGLPKSASKCKVWIARPKSEKSAAKQLSVDWIGITQRGETATNYILLPGDRLCVSNKDAIMEAARPASAVLPALLPTPVAARPVIVDARKLPLAGTWFREMPGAVAAFTFRDDEFSLAMTVVDDGETFTITLTGDCAITKDGTVHGVITGVDVNSADLKDQDSIDELAEMSRRMQAMVDQPFAIRFRPNGGGMMVSNVRLAESGMLKVFVPGFCGLYKSGACSQVPKPKAVNERKGVLHRCEPPMPMVLVPGSIGYGPPPCQHVPLLGPVYPPNQPVVEYRLSEFQHVPQGGLSPLPQDLAFPVGPVPAGYGP